ncbi:MAG TPA: bifunctional diaminohydroxyphosphoribosylaminopyrimidine deaminase/5-amino-6-(5-phosphoribosylamino)uracil reductase RibD [Thermoanaerobaculia bacterium]|nr:bifunctional diaminohydroxyphosphoribosylaminopyrimidine deaminase/5-amino-6-(5-phosphoribosylamino)uracil reductase RibD [Thermoanaerobaculia bacterium]
MKTDDETWMRRALALAEKGRWSTSPNPMVGAVLVRGGRFVAEGWHRRAGEPHAEIEALAAAGGRAKGATLYVTLEPCAHQGRTGPCADAIVRAGIRRVVAARRDPNPRVAGRGFRRLRAAGIEVEHGVLARESALQNERYDVWITRGRPFVLAKVAATLDGRIADSRGKSRWISGPAARRRSLEWREEFDAIVVGAATAEHDRARLTRRLGWNRTTPHRRIVLDGAFRVPEALPIFRGTGAEIWTSSRGDAAKERRLASRGVRVVRLRRARRGRGIDLAAALARLGAEDVTGLIVEGGTRTLTEFHAAGLIDRWAIILAPKLLGGAGAWPILGGPGVPLAKAPALSGMTASALGPDLLVTGRTRN